MPSRTASPSLKRMNSVMGGMPQPGSPRLMAAEEAVEETEPTLEGLAAAVKQLAVGQMLLMAKMELLIAPADHRGDFPVRACHVAWPGDLAGGGECFWLEGHCSDCGGV
jgi:hypothetical protein